MLKKKKTAKERREELRQKRLNTILKNNETNASNDIIIESNIDLVTDEDFMENSKLLKENDLKRKASLEEDVNILKLEKTNYQKELDLMKKRQIYPIPDFLVDSSKEKERRFVMEKIEFLLKYRFSLVEIADVLETNDYNRLDEIINRKEKIFYLSREYYEEEGLKPLKLFSGFKKVVGDEYSKVYFEQELKMKATISHIMEGKYFEKAIKSKHSKQEDISFKRVEVERIIEDIISNVIDYPEFNLACQIETEFINYEIDRAIKILSDLQLRSELEELLEDLRDISTKIVERSHAYMVMDKLINGKKEDRKIICPKDNNER